MKIFKLTGKVTISVYTEAEADTLEEAIEKTEYLSIVKSEWGQDWLQRENWVSDEYDGEVFDIEAE
jgi:hypothetical protein